MAKKTSIKSDILSKTTTTRTAGVISASVGRSRKGRDAVTRVTSPIKVTDTHARQWNRYSP